MRYNARENRDIRLSSQSLIPNPSLPCSDLDIGVIYTDERDLMSPLMESARASGRRLRMRLILVDNDSAGGIEPWCAGVRGNAESSITPAGPRYAANLNRILDGFVGQIRVAAEHRHVFRRV